MSKTPFNTGWVAEKSTATFWNIAIDDGPHSQVFASAHENAFIGIGPEEAERLARMIAAAPEMLKALKAMVLNDRHTYRDCHKAALAAIAKAEGEHGKQEAA